MVKYKPGDVLNVTKLIQLGKVGSGMLVIQKTVARASTTYGVYYVKHISGNLDFRWFNCEVFDKIEGIVKIGNIYEDDTLKVLYGS